MNDKSSLLGQLRIDRSETVAERPWLWWLAGGAAVAVVAAGAWFALARPSGVPVHAVTAVPAPGNGPSQAAGSLLDASGYVIAQLQSAVSGKSIYKVTDILVQEGQHVKKDEIIARLDDTNAHAALDQAQSQVKAAEANLAAAKIAFADITPIYERNKKLSAAGWLSQDAFDTSKATYDADQANLAVAQRQLDVAHGALEVAQRFEDDTIIRSPFDGVVTVKSAQPGQIVSPSFQGGGGVATIVDMDSLEVEVDVSENFISRVHAGQAVTIKLNAYPDWQIPGEVIAVIPTADQTKATVKVRIGFKEKDDRVLPQMGVRVSFYDDTKPAAGKPTSPGVIVPVEAVQANGDVGVVFVIKDRVVERRSVRLGARNPDGQVVLSGVAAGDRLAVGDGTSLTDGVKIRIE